MRITKQEHQAIKEVISSFDPEAKIYLFGSRANDSARGGDIDLLILSQKIKENDRRNLRIKLFDYIGEQKIDIVIAKDLSKPFVRIAFEKGSLL